MEMDWYNTREVAHNNNRLTRRIERESSHYLHVNN
jgi:hypothetical protein